MYTLGVHGFGHMVMHGSISQWENRISTLPCLSFCFHSLLQPSLPFPKKNGGWFLLVLIKNFLFFIFYFLFLILWGFRFLISICFPSLLLFPMAIYPSISLSFSQREKEKGERIRDNEEGKEHDSEKAISV